jgi:hypothetical protein
VAQEVASWAAPGCHHAIEGHAQAAWLGSVWIRVASIFSTFVIVITIQFTSFGALHGLHARTKIHIGASIR